MSPVYTVSLYCPVSTRKYPLDDPQNAMLFPGPIRWTTAQSHTYWLSDILTHHWNSTSNQQVLPGLLTLRNADWVRVEIQTPSEAAVSGWLTDFIKLEGPLWFPSLLWVNKAHRSIFGSPCPFSFQLLRSSMNNIFWVFLIELSAWFIL